MKSKKEPFIEKPYERLEFYGAETLSEAELISIVLRTGAKGFNSLEVAKMLLNHFQAIGSLRFLQEVSLEELRKIKGIGRVKALQIKAVSELAKRMRVPVQKMNKIIKSTKDVADLFMDELRFEKQEILKVLMLNSKMN